VLRFREIRVVDADNKQLGIMQSRAALTLAREQGLDLVMVSPNADPPVCRIIDYGKHKYLESKLGNNKKKPQQEVKGIKISPRIAENDIQTNVTKARKFIAEGDKVKVTCMFRAREVTHPELGRQKLDRFAELVADIAIVERAPQMEGRMMTMILLAKPSTGGQKKKDAKDQNKQDGGKAVQDNGNREDHPAEDPQQPPVPAQAEVGETTA
jgi:translation initiation factor IF-3